MPAEDDCGVVVEDPAVCTDQDIVAAWHLTGAAMAAGLHHRLRQRREAPHVVTGKLAAPGVCRQCSPRSELAVGDKWPALTFWAETVVFQGHEYCVGVAVVELAGANILAGDSRHPERDLGRTFCARLNAGVSVGAQIVTGCTLCIT